MNRNTIIGLIVAALVIAFTLVLCSRGGDQPATTTPTTTAPTVPEVIDRTPAAPDMAVGESCSASCDGTPITITCAEGETPVCDCNATPRTQCLPGARPATPAAAPTP